MILLLHQIPIQHRQAQMDIKDAAGMAERSLTYTEEVRVLWGYAPHRAEPMAGASRNRAETMIWKTFLVEMDHSRDKGFFRVKFMDSDTHCPEYCVYEPQDDEAGMPESWYEEQCECGIVHDGDGHDSKESYYGVGKVRNVPPQLQRDAQLPRTRTDESVYKDVKWCSDDEDVSLTVLMRTDNKLFLVDKNSNSNEDLLVQAVVLRKSGDGKERFGPAVRLEYASDDWLERDGAEVEGAESGSAMSVATSASDGAADDEENDEGDGSINEDVAEASEEDFQEVADGFWADTGDGDGGEDYSDEGHSNSSAYVVWYQGHSDRIVNLLSEWLDRMKREHGLLVSVYLYGHEQRPLRSWLRRPPGLPLPVAKGQNGLFERPQYGPSPRELRDIQEGKVRPLGSGRHMLRFKQNCLYTAAPVNACNVYLVRASIKDMTTSCLKSPVSISTL
jgi:hypothetical protein